MIPLCVDLDGSLIHTDLLHEASVKLARRLPWRLFFLLAWLLRGKAYLKRRIAALVDIDVESLPYNAALLDWLKGERAAGRRLVLCTASDAKYASAVAAHLGIFDEVLASDGVTNFSSDRKAEALVARFGRGGFDYVGNSAADLAVWRVARQAIAAGSDRIAARLRRARTLDKRIAPPSSGLWTWLRALRLHQWLKNILLFLPLLGAHRWSDHDAIMTVFTAMISFGLCASAVYIVNDLFDLDSDRRHPRKRLRPFAAGQLTIIEGIVAALGLFAVALIIALWLSPLFLTWLLMYAVLTTAYSIFLKAIPLLDCLALSGLYTLRIVAGGAVIQQPLSFWLLAFSLFLFLSLAYVKRYAELLTMVQSGLTSAHGRGYVASDSGLLQAFGVASGFSAALVLALYLNSETTAQLYSHPERLWLTLPILLFWISWVWLKASRDEMHDDPVVFAVRDPASLAAGALFIAAMGLAA